MSETERLCWAAFVADEIMPSGLATPDKWIAGRCEAGWIIGPKGRQERISYGCMIVPPGAEVLFMWHEPRGAREIIVKGDSTWRLIGIEPGDWTGICDADAQENIADTLEDFARFCIHLYDIAPGNELAVEARFSKWTEERFRLEVSESENAARFVPLAPESAADLASAAPEVSA